MSEDYRNVGACSLRSFRSGDSALRIHHCDFHANQFCRKLRQPIKLSVCCA